MSGSSRRSWSTTASRTRTGKPPVRASSAARTRSRPARSRIATWTGPFTFLALPGASITEASVGRNLKLLAFSEPLLAYLGKFGLGKGTIPAGTYPQAANAKDTVVSATMGTTITVTSKMANDLAYTITKTLNDNPDRVRKIHGSLADYDPAKAYLYLGVPLHPGAERYYREKGYLK